MKKCKVCFNITDIVRHHIAYEKYGAEKDIIISLCKDCHNFLHRFVKGKDPDIAFVTQNFIRAKKWW